MYFHEFSARVPASSAKRRESSKRLKVPPSLFIVENSFDIMCRRPQQLHQRGGKAVDDELEKSVRHVASLSGRNDVENKSRAGSRQALNGRQVFTASAAHKSRSKERRSRQLEPRGRGIPMANDGVCYSSAPSASDKVLGRERGAQARYAPPCSLHLEEYAPAAVQSPEQEGGSTSQRDDKWFGVFAFDSALARGAFLARWVRERRNRREQEEQAGMGLGGSRVVAAGAAEDGAIGRNVQDEDGDNAPPACAPPDMDDGMLRMGTCNTCSTPLTSTPTNVLPHGAELVGERVRVYWDGEGDWFAGYVSRFCSHQKKKPHFVQVGIVSRPSTCRDVDYVSLPCARR